MAVNVSNRRCNIKNQRSHAINATKTKQNVNLQVCRDENGKKVRTSTRERRTALKNKKAA